MPTVTLRPNGSTGTGVPTIVGAGSMAAATSDDSDASYFQFGQAWGGYGTTALFGLTFPAFTIPTNAVVLSVTPRVRWSGGYAASENLALQNKLGGESGWPDQFDDFSPGGTAATFTGAVRGGVWSQAALNSLSAYVAGYASLYFANNYKVYEYYLDVVYNFGPSVSVTGPSGIVTSLSPDTTFTYSDPEGDAKERHIRKIFRKPAAGWASLDPETNTVDLHASTGEIITSALTQATGVPITPGIVYRSYVKAGDTGSGGRYGFWAPGPDFKQEKAGWGMVIG